MIEFLGQWQTLIGAIAGGLFGFAAAIWTIRRTLQSEERRDSSDLESIKKALGAEIRQYAHQALNGHRACAGLARGGGNFSILQMQNTARFPAPVIYPNVANRLGLIGSQAHWVVFFFGQVQVFLSGRDDMRSLPNPNSIPSPNAIFAADVLLQACEAAVYLLPFLRSGDYYVRQDAKFADAVADARRQWDPDGRLSFTDPLS